MNVEKVLNFTMAYNTFNVSFEEWIFKSVRIFCNIDAITVLLDVPLIKENMIQLQNYVAHS